MMDRVGGPQGPQGQQQTVNVDISQADDIMCEKCECPYFTDVIRIKKLSMLLSPTGREEIINLQTLVCAGCGHEFTGIK